MHAQVVLSCYPTATQYMHLNSGVDQKILSIKKEPSEWFPMCNDKSFHVRHEARCST